MDLAEIQEPGHLLIISQREVAQVKGQLIYDEAIHKVSNKTENNMQYIGTQLPPI